MGDTDQRATEIHRRGEKMKANKFMYLPSMTQKEFVEHIEDNDFFRKYGNPVIIHAESGDDCVAMSVQLYDRIAKRCGHSCVEQLLKMEESIIYKGTVR